MRTVCQGLGSGLVEPLVVGHFFFQVSLFARTHVKQTEGFSPRSLNKCITPHYFSPLWIMPRPPNPIVVEAQRFNHAQFRLWVSLLHSCLLWMLALSSVLFLFNRCWLLSN